MANEIRLMNKSCWTQRMSALRTIAGEGKRRGIRLYKDHHDYGHKALFAKPKVGGVWTDIIMSRYLTGAFSAKLWLRNKYRLHARHCGRGDKFDSELKQLQLKEHGRYYPRYAGRSLICWPWLTVTNITKLTKLTAVLVFFKKTLRTRALVLRHNLK